MDLTLTPVTLGALASALTLQKVRNRFLLSRAKHRSLGGHSRISQRLAKLLPFYEYDEAQVFSSDGAPAEIADLRRAGFMRLSALYAQRFARTAAQTAEAAEDISD